LLSNAIKFTNYGVIEIGALAKQYHFVRLGIGIDENRCYFERFRQPMIH
jgi:hypothetical protein